MSIREILTNNSADWKNVYVNSINTVEDAVHDNATINGTLKLTGVSDGYLKTVGNDVTSVVSIPASDVTGLTNDFLKIDMSNAPVTNPGVTQEININKSVPNFGIRGATYMSSNSLFQETATNNLVLGVGDTSTKGIRLEIGQAIGACVRIGPWAAKRSMLILSNDGTPSINDHQIVGFGSLTYNDMTLQVRNAAAPFTFGHGVNSTTTQNRMTLTQNSLQFNGGNYLITDPDGNITIGTDNTTANNAVIIPSQANTLMICNSVGFAVVAATARLANIPASTQFSTSFNNIPGQYSCRYNGLKTRTCQVDINVSFAHSVAGSDVTFFLSKNGALTQLNTSVKQTYGALATVSNVKLSEQVTMNNNETIQIGVLSNTSGTLTFVFSSIRVTALLTV